MPETEPFDLLLRGGHVICPASGINGTMDVAVRGGKIAAVEANVLPSSAADIIDVSGRIVLPGLIDTHAHVYKYVTGRFGIDADMVGVQSGVTTLVDQGGPSCMTLPGFRHFVVEKATSRTYAFLSAYLVGGLEGHYYPSLYSPEGVNIDATVKAAMSSMMALGLTLDQVVPMVTSKPAELLRRSEEIGALLPGREADISVLNDLRGRFLLRDNEKNEVVAERLLQPAFCLRAGRMFDAISPILPKAVAA